MKKYLFAFVLVAIIVGIVVPLGMKTKKSHKEIPLTIGSTTLTALVSDTPQLRTNGLSGFPSLADTQAMLFIFENDGMWDFWMKDMNFSLDMIWVDQTKTIVGIEKNVSPDTFPKSFSAGKPSLYVIEVNAGIADKLGIKIGDRISF